MKPKKLTLGLVPLKNFGVVSNKYMIYRCAQPMFKHEYEWLAKVLKLDTIVNLRSESNRDEVYAKAIGIKVITIPVPDHGAPTKGQADEFVALVQKHALSPKPIMLHCEHGHGRTSTFCVLAKLALGYTLKQALKEESKKFHFAFSHFIQERFLEEYYEGMRRENLQARRGHALIRLKKKGKLGKYSISADHESLLIDPNEDIVCNSE